MQTIRIDPEFKDMIPPLSSLEYRELERSILAEGCRDAIILWNTTIVDGHNRYQICIRHKIPFNVDRIFFSSRDEAKAWICTRQLARRNLSDEMKRYLIGIRYQMEKRIGAHNQYGHNQYTGEKETVRYQSDTGPQHKTNAERAREKLAGEYNVSSSTIARYGAYCRAINRIKEVSADLGQRILTGQMKIEHKDLLELSKMPKGDIQDIECSLLKASSGLSPQSSMRSVVKSQIRRTQAGKSSIKDMPEYDPDAEIKSLSLTIPSWVSSIDRTRSTSNFSDLSNSAKNGIIKELERLQNSIRGMIDALEGSGYEQL